MSNKKITLWEVGQELIEASDCLDECICEIRGSISKDDYLLLRRLQAELGEIFLRNNDHYFSIYDLRDFEKETKDEP